MKAITDLASDLFSKIQNQKINLKIKCLSLRFLLNHNTVIQFILELGENLQHISECKSIKQANIKDINISLSKKQQSSFSKVYQPKYHQENAGRFAWLLQNSFSSLMVAMQIEGTFYWEYRLSFQMNNCLQHIFFIRYHSFTESSPQSMFRESSIYSSEWFCFFPFFPKSLTITLYLE